jgi:hypothetical protein
MTVPVKSESGFRNRAWRDRLRQLSRDLPYHLIAELAPGLLGCGGYHRRLSYPTA